MFSDKTSIESTTGLLAVGSLCLLGIFMFLDGRTEISYVVENYGKSTVFGIVAALPTLVVAYIFGMLAVAIAELFFTLPDCKPPSDRARDRTKPFNTTISSSRAESMNISSEVALSGFKN